jgi:GxxExxY protein
MQRQRRHRDTEITEDSWLSLAGHYDPVFQSQVLTYLRCTGKRLGLLINFNSRLLHSGVKRTSL